MSSKVIQEVEKYLRENWDAELCARILKLAGERFDQLCQENAGDGKAVRTHTEGNLFPCISLYQALQGCGIPAEEALTFLDRTWSRRAEAGARSISKMLHVAGLYKLYPAIFSMVAKKQFGPAAGFSAKFYDCGKQHCKFDMTRCLFCDTCKRYGCPELTKCFCHVDDVNNGNLHPRLCWNRTQFMGGGGEYCDFDIFVTDRKTK